MATSSRTLPEVLSVDQIYDAIEILREIYPDFNFNSYVQLARLISKEFSCICTVNNVITALEPSLEAIELDYKLIYEHCVE